MIKGIIFAIGASCLFGLVYYFPVLLAPLSVVEIFCWRLLMSCPAIAILITIQKSWGNVYHLLKRIIKQPLLVFAFLFSSSMLAIQMLIFIWAPLNGKALSTSLGYFILPLGMVVGGRLVYNEKFSIYQKVAITLALIGVINEVWVTAAFNWDTLVVSIGYPIYLIFRRKMNMEGIEGTFADFFLIAIGSAIFMSVHYTPHQIIQGFLYHPIAIPMLGMITAVAFAIYFAAAKLLPLGLFGLLSYTEPVLLTAISLVFLHETLSADQVFTYMMIWSAVCLLVLEGIVFTVRGLAQRKFLKRLENNTSK